MAEVPLFSSSRAGGTFSTNPFENSVLFAENVKDTVTGQFTWTKNHILGDTNLDSITLTQSAIDSLKDFNLELPDDIQLLEPDFDPTIFIEWDLPDIEDEQFGKISPFTPGDAPVLGSIPTISSVTIPKFSPSIAHLSIPPTPAPGNFEFTTPVPTHDEFVFPLTPVYTLPDSPTLLPITIPSTPNIVLPTLSLEPFPVLADLNIDTLIPWTEPTFSPEIWTDVKAQLLTFFAGGTGIRPDVEEAMVNRGMDREARVVRQQVQQAEEEWASRGYLAPPGMLTKRIDSLREEGLIKKLGLNREIVIKVMDAEMENLRFAVQQGIVGEQLFLQIFLAAAERLFMVQRLHVEMQIQLYNSLIAAFNAKLQQNMVRAQVYEVRVRAALAEIEVFKALIDAESVKADMNTTFIEGYKAEISARQTIVQLYSEEIKAVGVKADVFETEVGAYRAEIEAFSALVGADKHRFDAYATAMEGEKAKADIISSEARAYQAEISGIDVGVRAEVGALEGAVSTFEAEVLGFQAKLTGLEGINRNELAAIQAHVAGYQAGTTRFVANATVEEAKSKLELGTWQAKQAITIAQYEAQIKRFQALLEKAVQQANMALEGIKSAGQLASTISAGALAAMHVGATISGSGGVSASGSDAVSFSYSDSQSKSCAESKAISVSYEADSEPDIGCQNI